MREVVDLGIKHVWMLRAFGAGSVWDAAAEYGRSHGVADLAGGCPLMFGKVSDPGPA